MTIVIVEILNHIISASIYSLSMGLLVDPNKPIVWRGPLVISALQRLLKGAVWGPLDILIVDTPPGTGDIHLSLAQNVPISGAVLISTPQSAALEVTRRGAEMYRTMKIPLIGLVENMRYVSCDKCGTDIEIFGHKTEQFAKELGVDILESIPIVPYVAECSDNGVPLVIKDPDSKYAKSFERIAQHVLHFLIKKQNHEIV